MQLPIKHDSCDRHSSSIQLHKTQLIPYNQRLSHFQFNGYQLSSTAINVLCTTKSGYFSEGISFVLN